MLLLGLELLPLYILTCLSLTFFYSLKQQPCLSARILYHYLILRMFSQLMLPRPTLLSTFSVSQWYRHCPKFAIWRVTYYLRLGTSAGFCQFAVQLAWIQWAKGSIGSWST